MATEQAAGWLIHKHQIGPKYTQLSVFTREVGVVQVRARSQMLLKKNDAVQLFTLLWCSIDTRAYGTYLQKIEPLGATQSLIGHYGLVGLYLNELIYRLLPLQQPEELLFASYACSLQALVLRPSAFELEVILRRFEWQLLLAAGVLVSFTETSDNMAPVDPDKYYTFNPSTGFSVAHQGYLGAHLLAIGRDELHCTQVLRSAKHLMRQAIDHLLNGVPLHSRRLYRYSIHNNHHSTG